MAVAVFNKDVLQSHCSFCQLRLAHAAFVASYPVNDPASKMVVNRVFFVRDDDSAKASMIRDLSTGEILPLRDGNIYFTPCKHLIDLKIAEDLHFFSIQFNFEIFYGFDLMESCLRCETMHAPDLVAEIEVLFKRDGELRTVCKVNEIIYGLCARWAPPADSDEIRNRIAKSEKYGKTLEFIRRSADATTTVEMLAEIHGTRKDVFSRSFSRDLGVSPKDFLSDDLTRKASSALLSPGSSVAAAAKKLKFSSEYYFSHFFKRRVGVSPSEFQRINGLRQS